MDEALEEKLIEAREILTGKSVIRAFNTEKREEERFEDANNKLMKTNIFVNRTMSMMMPTMSLIPVPTKKERRAPKPTITAWRKGNFLDIISPNTAPTNGPKIIPSNASNAKLISGRNNGVKTIPIIRKIISHITQTFICCKHLITLSRTMHWNKSLSPSRQVNMTDF